MKFILVIWLVTPSNFAEYDKFLNLNQCVEKMQMVQRALLQANSQMNVECRKIEGV